MNTNFYAEEKELLQAYIDQAVFKEEYTFDCILQNYSHTTDFTMGSTGEGDNIQGVELIIRPECNQKCEYCYIARYGKELYPLSERLTNEQILHNIDMLCEYVFETKNLYINHWEFFAGDLFYDDLFFDVCDIFYEHLMKKKYQYPGVFKKHEGVIVTPTNFSFIMNDEKKKHLEEYIVKFHNDLNWELGFSVSTDGKYAIDTREGHEVPDEFFDRCFQWTIDHPRNGFHPMLSASNIHNGIKNYEWWRDITKKWYSNNPEKHEEFLPYWLEARNDEWKQENIDDYLRLLDFMVNDRLKMCDNNIDALARHFLMGEMSEEGVFPSLRYNDLIWFSLPNKEALYKLGCAMSGLFIINVSNLGIVPCHRLTYPQFKGGTFTVEDDKITDIAPFNVTCYLNAKMAPAKYFPQCADCKINVLCHKGCLGAQFEASGELFQPCASVCNLEIQIKEFLVYKYEKMGLWDSVRNQNLPPVFLMNIIQPLLDSITDERKAYYDQFITN